MLKRNHALKDKRIGGIIDISYNHRDVSLDSPLFTENNENQ